MEITIVSKAIHLDEVKKIAKATFGDMVKIVVDVERCVMAAGGEWHADAEALLLQDGSQQEHLWGANLYPDSYPEDWIVYNSLINIRPHQGNREMDITDEGLQKKIKGVVDLLVTQ